MKEWQKAMMDFTNKVWEGIKTPEDRNAWCKIQPDLTELDRIAFRQMLIDEKIIDKIISGFARRLKSKKLIIEELRKNDDWINFFQLKNEVNECFKLLK